MKYPKVYLRIYFIEIGKSSFFFCQQRKFIFKGENKNDKYETYS